MGFNQSKEEQIVIAQNPTEVEAHMSRQSLMTMIVIGILLFIVGCAMIRKVRECIRRQFRSRIRTWLREETTGPVPALTHVQVLQPVAAPAAVANPAPVATQYA